MLPTIIFFLALLTTIGTLPFALIIDEKSKLSAFKQDMLICGYSIIPCILWSYLFYLLH